MANNAPDIERSGSEQEMKVPITDEGKTERDTNVSARVGRWEKLLNLLERRGDVEIRGATPVPYDLRTETKYVNIFTLWFGVSCNPLP